MAINDITGDEIRTKPSSTYRDRFDDICWSKEHHPPLGYDGTGYKCPDCGRITKINLDPIISLDV